VAINKTTKRHFFSGRDDASEVVEIMQEMMVDIFNDGVGSLDFSRLPNGAGMSSRSVSCSLAASLIFRQCKVVSLNPGTLVAQNCHIKCFLSIAISY